MNIIRLNAVITVTVETLNRSLMEKDRDCTENSVVGNCDAFLDGYKAVDRIQTAQGSRTNTAVRLGLYYK